jgi:hypothetical protein
VGVTLGGFDVTMPEDFLQTFQIAALIQVMRAIRVAQSVRTRPSTHYSGFGKGTLHNPLKARYVQRLSQATPKDRAIIAVTVLQGGPAPILGPFIRRLFQLFWHRCSCEFNRWHIPQRSMRSLPVVVLSPFLYLLPSVLQGQKPALVQAFFPKTSVECFY